MSQDSYPRVASSWRSLGLAGSCCDVHAFDPRVGCEIIEGMVGPRTLSILALVIAATGVACSSDAPDNQERVDPISALGATPALLDEGGVLPTRFVWGEPATLIGGDAVPVAFWTGETVVVLKTTNGGNDVTGEQWDPTTNTATRIADSGLTWRSNPASVWTGTEVLLVGGSSGPALNAIGKAYNPTTDTWRTLADPPRPVDGWQNSIVGHAAWTGTEMIMWQSNLAYNPNTDIWRALTVTPLQFTARRAAVWTGSELIIWGGCHIENDQCDETNSGLLADGAIYDPATDTWTEIPPSPLSGAVHLVSGWTGTEALFIVTDPHDGAENTAAAFNPASRTWRNIAPLPLSTRRHSAAAWTGDSFIVWGGGDGLSDRGINDGAAYHPDLNAWTLLPESPGPGRSLHTVVSTGDTIYISATRTVNPPLSLSQTASE